ncbi:TPA: hypothetical protein ACYTJQ_002072 [Yersinia enterocolitica]|uniref:hypothetical protein n=1 Tax=Yersinia enterocolitica TaxID=630 RepID=UPI0028DFB692|nr:hypothetical protein [Yersinia enterocolitica]HEC1641780.1 hypothetical protein [Yersinia enterocolitica]HEN3297017.1 hypothetical protein [Yersinia enterocolitica]
MPQTYPASAPVFIYSHQNDSATNNPSNILSYNELTRAKHTVEEPIVDFLASKVIAYHEGILNEFYTHLNNSSLGCIENDVKTNRSIGLLKQSFDIQHDNLFRLRERVYGSYINGEWRPKEIVTMEGRDQYIGELGAYAKTIEEFNDRIKLMPSIFALEIENQQIGKLNGHGVVHKDVHQWNCGNPVPCLPCMDDDSDLECG